MGKIIEIAEGIKIICFIPIDIVIKLVNNIGIQRIAALSSLMVYLYLEAMCLPVTPGFFGIMTALNGLHAAKSIYGRGVEKGMNNQKKE